MANVRRLRHFVFCSCGFTHGVRTASPPAEGGDDRICGVRGVSVLGQPSNRSLATSHGGGRQNLNELLCARQGSSCNRPTLCRGLDQAVGRGRTARRDWGAGGPLQQTSAFYSIGTAAGRPVGPTGTRADGFHCACGPRCVRPLNPTSNARTTARTSSNPGVSPKNIDSRMAS